MSPHRKSCVTRPIEAKQLALDFGVESSMRIDVHNAKVAAQKNIEASGKKLNPEEQRLVEKMVQDGTRAGPDSAGAAG